MALIFVRNIRLPSHKTWMLLVLLLFSFGISLTGCNEACFSFTSNPPNGNIMIKAGDPKPTCTLTVAKANVRVVTHTVSTCTSCSLSNQVRQIVVNLIGVALHPGAIADNTSPDWQELLPGTAPHGLQLDFARDSSGLQAVGQPVSIPAATYRQLRLRFSASSASARDVKLERDRCGDAGPNCVVMGDGRVLPLLLGGAEPELRLTPEKEFVFPSDSSSDLTVEFGIAWLLSPSEGQGARLLPALTASVAIERSPGRQSGTE